MRQKTRRMTVNAMQLEFVRGNAVLRGYTNETMRVVTIPLKLDCDFQFFARETLKALREERDRLAKALAEKWNLVKNCLE